MEAEMWREQAALDRMFMWVLATLDSAQNVWIYREVVCILTPNILALSIKDPKK
jgi:hypothetical protein